VSHKQLLEVEASRALEATRRFEDLAFYHVPFDELNGDQHTESTLTRLVANGDRVVVVGASGSGKSSVISSVLGPLATELPNRIVPLRVPVAAESDETVTEPGALARHLVRYVTRWASRDRFSPEEQEEFERGVADATRRAAGKKIREFHVGLPLWLAKAEFARQVQATGDEYETRGSPSDAVEYMKRLVALFEAHGLSPVLVFDDSDTWLNIAGLDRSAVANEFFMRSVRMLCKEVPTGLVIAVHEHYLELAGYREASTWLSAEIWVPRLIGAREGIERILRDRLAMADVEAQLEEVIGPDAIDRISKHYDEGMAIRDVLRVAQRALQHALSDGTERISSQLIEQAITELAP
jgi:Cdc6-like AAA superfamily ATPase